jgi:hypothetical protein
VTRTVPWGTVAPPPTSPMHPMPDATAAAKPISNDAAFMVAPSTARAAVDGVEFRVAGAFDPAGGAVCAAHRTTTPARHRAGRASLAGDAPALPQRDRATRLLAAVDAARITAGAAAGRLRPARQRAAHPADLRRHLTARPTRAGAAASGARGRRRRAATACRRAEDRQQHRQTHHSCDREAWLSCHAREVPRPVSDQAAAPS